MLDIIILSIGGIYLVLVLVTLGMFRLPKSYSAKDEDLPTVSVIISAKNEEIDLPKCIASLEKLDFPKNKLQIVLVDDKSTDQTGPIIKDAAKRNSHFISLSTDDAPEVGLKAKARGISWGIKNSESEWILITDADGEVPSLWVRHMLSRVDGKTGMIGGMLSVKPSSLIGIFERISWGYTLPFAFGMAGWGASFICVGPNMGIRRSIYEENGGLENVDFDVAEDLALFRMVENSDYNFCSYVTPETTILLNPVPSLKHLWSQQRRWLGGGFEGGWKYGIPLILAFGYLTAYSFFQITGWFYALEATLAIVLIRLFGDAFILVEKRILLKKTHLFRYLPIQWLYGTLTMAWLPISLLFDSRIRWRGDGYEIKYDK